MSVICPLTEPGLAACDHIGRSSFNFLCIVSTEVSFNGNLKLHWSIHDVVFCRVPLLPNRNVC